VLDKFLVDFGEATKNAEVGGELLAHLNKCANKI
jgi:hypothetical protein